MQSLEPGLMGHLQSDNESRDLAVLFANNREWARRMRDADPQFFSRLANYQAPRYLWIGCSDSRVPANEIIGLRPGEVFVHRNVANLVAPTDVNCLAVVEYAIHILKVSHIMVVGHYGCGGIQAVLTGQRTGLVGHWLHQVEMIMHMHARRLDAVCDRGELADRLCELNVIEQVGQLSRVQSVQEAWKRGQSVTLHGLIYDVGDGQLRNIGVSITGAPDLRNWRKATLTRLWSQRTRQHAAPDHQPAQASVDGIPAATWRKTTKRGAT